MTIAIRVLLALILLDELVVGGWNQFFPQGFYDNFPTVNQTPPFSEHYARDFGGATLGIALVLAIALVRPAAHFAIPAALAFTMFAVPHFVFHLEHLEHASAADAAFLTIGNGTVVLAGIAVVVLAVLRARSPRNATQAEFGSATSGPA